MGKNLFYGNGKRKTGTKNSRSHRTLLFTEGSNLLLLSERKEKTFFYFPFLGKEKLSFTFLFSERKIFLLLFFSRKGKTFFYFPFLGKESFHTLPTFLSFYSERKDFGFSLLLIFFLG
jgi:hypothetical protein